MEEFSLLNWGYSKRKDFLLETLTLLHSERPKLYAILAFLSATGLKYWRCWVLAVTTMTCCTSVCIPFPMLYHCSGPNYSVIKE